MNPPQRCRTCGADLPDTSPEGLCLKCLLAGGLELLRQAPSSPFAEEPTQTSVSATPFPGTKLPYFGDYELLEEIARGGMGTVFRARQMSLNRVVALKLISAGALATEDLVKRLKAEAEAAASLSHPNIVPIHEIGEHQGQHYFSMALIEGPNLRLAISNLEFRIARPRKGAQLVATMARAVHYAHQRGVLHRDIKPSNILLDAQGEPHLTDFGLAKLVEKESTLTHTNAVLGTPAYMSPEQARGDTKNVTTATDVYGLGAVLYETLTGSPPFAGGTSLETIRQVLEQDPRPPSFFNDAIDRDLETICLKCLEKEPGRRYSSAAGLSADLERWLHGEPVMARRTSSGERLWKWVRRRPAIAGLGSLSILAILALAIGSTLAAFRIASARAVVRRNLYTSQMNVAFQSWETGDATRARAVLTNQIPRAGEEDLRGWEWRYLWGRSRPRELAILSTWPQNALSIAYSPDGKTFVTQEVPSLLRLWDTESRRPLATLTNDLREPFGYSVAFSKDGKLALSTHYDERMVLLWDTHERRLVGKFTNHTMGVFSAAFTPDGANVVSTGGKVYTTNGLGELKLWNASSFREIGAFEPAGFPILRCDVSPDGRLVAASGGSQIVHIWDLHSRALVARLPGHDIKSNGDVLGLRFSPDGHFLATADFAGTVRLWNVSTNTVGWGLHEPIVLGSHGQPVYSLSFSPNGQLLASASRDHTAKLWDVANQREPATLRGHAGRVWDVAFSPDGHTLATSAMDASVRFWSTDSASDDNVFARNTGEGRTGFSASGRFLAWEDPGLKVITVWDLARSNALRRMNGESFAFSPADNRIAVVSAAGQLQVWSLDPLTEEPGPPQTTAAPTRWTGAAFSPHGDQLAAISAAGDIHVWTVEGWKEFPTIEAKAGWVLFALDGHFLLSESPAGDISLWRIGTKERRGVFKVHHEGVWPASISPDRRTLATGSDDTLRLWDISTQREIAAFKTGGGAITSFAFANDGKTIAVGGYDGAIQLWNIASRQQAATLGGHLSFVCSLAFSPDKRTLASTSMEGTLRLWKAPAMEEVDHAGQPQP